MGKNGGCKPFARLSVKMDGEENIAVFLLRTTGYNSIKSLPARLAYYLAISDGLLSCMPLSFAFERRVQAWAARLLFTMWTLR